MQQRQKLPRSTPVRQPQLAALQHLLQTHGHDALQVEGRFQGTWIPGRVRGRNARVVRNHTLLQVTGAFDGADLEEADAGTLYVTLQYDNQNVEDEAWSDLQLHWGQGKQSLQSRNQALRVQQASNEFLQLLRDADALQELSQQQVKVKRERGTTITAGEHLDTHQPHRRR